MLPTLARDDEVAIRVTQAISLTGRMAVYYHGQSNVSGGDFYFFSTTHRYDYATPFSAVRLTENIADSTVDPIVYSAGQRSNVAIATRTAAGTFTLGDMGPQVELAQELDWSYPNSWIIHDEALGGSSAADWRFAADGGVYPASGTKYPDQVLTRFQATEASTGASPGAGVAVLVNSQGTTDAVNGGTFVTNYQTRLQAKIGRFHTAFPSAPQIISLTPTTFNGGVANTLTIRNAQIAVAAALSAYCTTVSEEGFHTNNTTGHHRPTGYVELARRTAVEIFNRLGLLQKPRAAFRQRLDASLAVQFTDESECRQSAPTAWAWSSSDGGSATTQNWTRTFAGAGSYTVTLTVTSGNGRTDVTSQTVDVSVVASIIDAGANARRFPITSSDWTSFLASARVTTGNPTSSWKGDQPVGAPGPHCVDQIGSITLSNSNITLLNQTGGSGLTGITRGCYANLDAASNHSMSNTTTVGNATTDPVVFLFFIEFPGSLPAAVREIAGWGSSTTLKMQWGNDDGKIRINGTATANRMNSVMTGYQGWIAIQADPLATRPYLQIYTELESFKMDLTPVSGLALWTAGLTATTAACKYGPMALFTGTTARNMGRPQLRSILNQSNSTALIPW